MKTTMLILTILLTGCGGMEAEEDPSFKAAVESSLVQSCMTKAVRSNTGSYDQHSRDGGKTWLPGACS